MTNANEPRVIIKHPANVVPLEDYDKLKAENIKLKRIIAKELTENDELGSEFVYVTIMKREVQGYREALEQIDAEWCKHPYIRFDLNPKLERDWCGHCNEWISRDEVNPARQALETKDE